MKTKEITIEVEEYTFIPEEEMFTLRDLSGLFFGILALFVFVISFYLIFWPVG